MNRAGKMTLLYWKLECIGQCKEIDEEPEGESGSVGDSEEEGDDKESRRVLLVSRVSKFQRRRRRKTHVIYFQNLLKTT